MAAARLSPDVKLLSVLTQTKLKNPLPIGPAGQVADADKGVAVGILAVDGDLTGTAAERGKGCVGERVDAQPLYAVVKESSPERVRLKTVSLPNRPMSATSAFRFWLPT
ncbi:MAG: hypothetical protein PHI87_06110 [Candidatus Methanomethylophilus sp.]|nr:hypothetical protein [Methanomethylophilus sp.]